MPTTWGQAEDVLRAQAEIDIFCGAAPRPHLITFEGVLATLVALGPEGSAVDTTRALVELTELVEAVRAERFALGTALVDGAEQSGGRDDVELTPAALTAPRCHLRIRVWPGRRRRRVRLHGAAYGRSDSGAPRWGRSRRFLLWRRDALRARLIEAIGPGRSGSPRAEVVASYLVREGYRIAVSPGWVDRYGLGRLVADH